MKIIGYFFIFQITNKDAEHVFELHMPLFFSLPMFQACPLPRESLICLKTQVYFMSPSSRLALRENPSFGPL